MPQIKMFTSVPKDSLILENFGKYDYCDSFRIITVTSDSVDSITNKIFKMPQWVQFLFRIRNVLVKVFGLKTGTVKSDKVSDYYEIGTKSSVFSVVDRNQNEIVMAENDKHLCFRASVLVKRNGNEATIHVTTIVRFNNFGGWLYFLPVKPFHKLIIKSLLKRLKNDSK